MIPAFRSLRILRRHWKLTAIAVFSLSIAMALGVVSASVLNTFLLLPPAGSEPDRLVNIYTRTPSTPSIKSLSRLSVLPGKYHVFTDIAGAPNSLSLLAIRAAATRLSLQPDPFPETISQHSEFVRISVAFSRRPMTKASQL